jgi:hypothetical protein
MLVIFPFCEKYGGLEWEEEHVDSDYTYSKYSYRVADHYPQAVGTP